MHNPIMPTPLPQKPTLGIFAPAFAADQETDIKTLVIALEDLGIATKIHPQCFAKHHQFAGTAEERNQAFHDLLLDSQVDGIMALRGGYGCLQFVEHLDFKLITRMQKPIIGFSDMSVLLNAITTKSGLVTFHGPMLGFNFSNHENHPTQFPQLLQKFPVEWLQNTGTVINDGSAEGRLIGGNFTVFDQLIGTDFLPTHEDFVLLIEDTNTKINDMEKYFIHLHHAGLLTRIKGVIIGEMNLGDNDVPFGQTVEEIAQRFVNGPIITDISAGHIHNRTILPIGLPVKLTAQGKHCALEQAY